jgi:antirestriction protein ArdC
VKRGEKSELVVFWKFLDVEDKDAQPGETSSKQKQIPFLRHYSLFNAEQTEGIDYVKIAKQEPRLTDPIEARRDNRPQHAESPAFGDRQDSQSLLLQPKITCT